MTCPICERVRAAIDEWAKKQGHEACWYYPEIFNQIAELLGSKACLADPTVPRKEFRGHCRQFEQQVYIGSKNHCDGKRIDRAAQRGGG